MDKIFINKVPYIEISNNEKNHYVKILKISVEETYNQGLEFYSFEIREKADFLIDFIEEQKTSLIKNKSKNKLNILTRLLKEYSTSLGFEKIPYNEFSYFVIDDSESSISVKGIVAIRPVISGIGEEILMGLKNISFTHYDSDELGCERLNLTVGFKYIKELENVKKELNSIFDNYKDFKYHYLNIFEPKKGVSYMSRSVLNELVTFLYRKNNDDINNCDEAHIPVNIQFFEATYLFSLNNDEQKPKYYFYKIYENEIEAQLNFLYEKLKIFPLVLSFRQRVKGTYNIIEIFQIFLLMENLKYKTEDRSFYRKDEKIYTLEYLINNFSIVYERLLNEAGIYFQLEHCNVENLLYNYWVEGKKLLLENPEICFLESKQRFSNMQYVTMYNGNIYKKFLYKDLYAGRESVENFENLSEVEFK